MAPSAGTRNQSQQGSACRPGAYWAGIAKKPTEFARGGKVIAPTGAVFSRSVGTRHQSDTRTNVIRAAIGREMQRNRQDVLVASLGNIGKFARFFLEAWVQTTNQKEVNKGGRWLLVRHTACSRRFFGVNARDDGEIAPATNQTPDSDGIRAVIGRKWQRRSR